jgi:N-acetyl-anhydromuramyl-L-alanine amidase AmpD
MKEEILCDGEIKIYDLEFKNLSKRSKTDLLIIHCAATPPNMDIGAREIHQWHLNRGWSGIGYHYVICRDGSIEQGRPEWAIGAHAHGYNDESVSVCLVGGIAKDKTPENNFTEVQFCTLEWIVQKIKKKYPNIKIIGHNEVSSKACPSFDVQEWLQEWGGIA